MAPRPDAPHPPAPRPLLLPTLAASVLAAAVLWAAPAPGAAAADGIRTCVMPDGNTVYTDASCAALGAVARPVPRDGSPATTRVYHGRCSATLPDLVYEVTSAIDSRDVNRLAAHYHWPGLPGTVANATMDRLEVIALRPLLDVRLDTVDVPRPAREGSALSVPGAFDPFAADRVDARPSGLRLEQLTRDGGAPATTVFALRRHLGCWWVRL